MSSLLLVGNPAKRRHKKRRASPAQLAARAKFAAMARARRRNPAKRRKHHAKSRTHTRTVIMSNPHHRKHRRHRTRRNPIRGISMRGVTQQLKTAAVGAAGAVGVDLVYGYLQSYLPDAIKSPQAADGSANYAYYAAKGAVAVGAGLLLKKVISPAKAAAVTEGSLVVTMHDMFARFVANNFQSMTLGNMPGGRVLPPLPASQSLNAYVGNAPYRGVPAPVNQNLRAYIPASSRESVTR